MVLVAVLWRCCSASCPTPSAVSSSPVKLEGENGFHQLVTSRTGFTGPHLFPRTRPCIYPRRKGVTTRTLGNTNGGASGVFEGKQQILTQHLRVIRVVFVFLQNEQERAQPRWTVLPALPQPSRMSKQQHYRTPLRLTDTVVEVKSKFEAEYRRFALKRNSPGDFQEFYRLLQTIHHIPGVDVLLGYADVHGDLLPINNDDNFLKAVSLASPLLRIIISKKEDEPGVFATNSLQRRKKGLGLTGLRTTVSGTAHSKNKPGLMIGLPQNFRQISSIIDVDILPETHRRVRLHKHGTHKPLGFYIRDGVSVRVTPQGVEKVPGVFISRLVRGGLAESTGLLGVNDEILEVNGIDVTGKSLDQVTDMMVANSHNLIVTVKPANQRNNVVHRGSKTYVGNCGSVGSAGSTGSTLSHDSPSPASQSNPITASNSIAEGDSDNEDDDRDLILENDCLTPFDSHHITNSNNTNLYDRDSLTSKLHSATVRRPIPQSISLPNSVGASLSDNSTTMSTLNGNTASSSHENMREDGNIITL